jgi:hypothetical protein
MLTTPLKYMVAVVLVLLERQPKAVAVVVAALI